MFGSLRPPRDRFTPEQKELYRSHYCGLCHSLDTLGGKFASLLTNYDITFFLLVLAALENDREVDYKPCTVMFLRQVPVLIMRPQTRQLVAALTLALAGAKVEDDLHDGDRPWVKWAFLPLQKTWKQAGLILDKLGFPRQAIEGLGTEQRAAEAQALSLQELTLPTQRMLGSVFAFIADYTQQPQYQQALQEVGHALGLWIYLYDAWSDQGKDKKNGVFNALLRFPVADQELGTQMLHALQHARRALSHLPLGERRPLLEEQLNRLHSLTLHQFRPEQAHWDGRSCWLGAGGLLAASWQPQMTAACDSCDCNCDGCNCDGCDCSGCECKGCACDACDAGICKECNCDICNECDCCDSCKLCDHVDICDCNQCDLSACDHCNTCGDMECKVCEGTDCCTLCDCCDPDCCDVCKCSSGWDCCLCVDAPGQAKAMKQQRKVSTQKKATDEGEIPGIIYRPKRKYPWSKKRRMSSGVADGSEEPAQTDATEIQPPETKG